MTSSVITTAIVSMVAGSALAALTTFMGVTALAPPVEQSDAPLIVYGQN